jgi:hypothetical protein
MNVTAEATKTRTDAEGPAQNARSGEYLDYLKKINDIFYDQIKIADQKAAYIFTFLLAFIISSAEGRSAFTWQRYQEGTALGALFAALLALGLVVSLVSAIMVVLPRLRSGATTALYWGAWEGHRGTLEDAMRRGDTDYIRKEYLGNIDNLSAIARSKYRFVGLAFRALLVAVVAYVLLLLAA